ncbi:MAG: hypothetical protein ABEI13_00785 [Candidatus Paceibacteria bacterium]
MELVTLIFLTVAEVGILGSQIYTIYQKQYSGLPLSWLGYMASFYGAGVLYTSTHANFNVGYITHFAVLLISISALLVYTGWIDRTRINTIQIGGGLLSTLLIPVLLFLDNTRMFYPFAYSQIVLLACTYPYNGTIFLENSQAINLQYYGGILAVVGLWEVHEWMFPKNEEVMLFTVLASFVPIFLLFAISKTFFQKRDT